MVLLPATEVLGRVAPLLAGVRETLWSAKDEASSNVEADPRRRERKLFPVVGRFITL